MKRFLLPFLFLLSIAPAWSATPTTVVKARQRATLKEPYVILLGVDPTNSSKVIKILIDGTGAIVATFPVGASIKQGDQADTSGSPWFFTMTRRSDGAEFGLAGSPFATSLFDAASNLLGVTANPLVVDLGVNNDVTVNNTAGASAVFVQGQAADGAAVAGNPVRMAGKSFVGNTEDLAVDTGGNIAWNTVAAADNQSLVNTARPRNSNDGSGPLMVLPLLFDGSTGDLAPGNSVDGALVNLGANNDVTTSSNALPLGAPGQDHKAVVVGTGPTLILAADTGRRFATVCNADNTLVAIGNSDVTLNTVVATDGKVLGISGTADADDGKGGCFTFETTAAIHGKGTDAGSKVTIFWGTD